MSVDVKAAFAFKAGVGKKTASNESTSKSQRSALKDLFRTTGGPDWTCNTNWNPPAQDVSLWYGVRCFINGDVVSLQLGNNNLTGKQLSQFKYIASL